MSRTIFVLGAGFSAPANMPVQADLMRAIVERASQERVRGTVQSLFNIFQVADMARVPLEDIFTMLDRARKARETIRGFTAEQLEQSYRLLITSITAEFRRRLTGFAGGPYEAFASELVRRRVGDSSVEAEQSSPFTLLTLNWDTIPDFQIAKTGGPRGVSVDYGCAVHDMADAAARPLATPGPSPGRFPIRLLKLHGSLNWLACTSCDRLFTAFDGSAGPPVASPDHHSCPMCNNSNLSHVIITPTLLKDLGQIHLKAVWHAALLELQEARRLVFLGYSLPLADFEFRYLLLRAMAARHDLHIRVVLYPPDERVTDPRQRFERSEVEQRYRQFFGDRDLEFKYMDAASFMVDPLLLWHW